MIVLGVDLGERRVGFAVSDEKELLAVPAGFAPVRALEDALREVLAKAVEVNAEYVVVGNPLNMDGRSGPKAKEAAAFLELLKESGINAALWDERLTTAEAARLLKDAGFNRRQRKGRIDANAAQRLLESFLEWRRRGGGGNALILHPHV